MTKMIPDQALIYERQNGVVYARYRDPPHNELERWIVGGDPDAVSRATGDLFSWSEWQELCRLTETNYTLQTQMKKLLDLYYIIKDDK
jgi:hypothetical protein